MLSRIMQILRRRFANKTAGELVQDNYTGVNHIAYYVGCDILTKNYSWLNVRLGLVALDIVTYIMIDFYSLYYNWGNMVAVAFCLVTLAMGFQGVAKILTFVKFGPFFSEFFEAYQLIYSTKFENPKITCVQEKYAMNCSILTFGLQRLYLGSALLLATLPMVATIFFERTLPFGFILPFIEPYGNPGFYLNYLHHVLQIFCVAIGVIATDVIFISIVVLGLGNIEIMKVILDELSEKSSRNGKDEPKMAELSKLLTDLIEMHQKIFQYLRSFQQLMQWHNCVQIGCLVFQLTVTLVVCSLSTWYPGYVLFLVTYFQLFVACMFSSLITIRFEVLVDEIYCSNWYLLSMPDQKRILQLLMMAQKAFHITYVLGNLNLQTFLEVSKKVYQLFMLVQSFSEEIL